ncbi:MAG: hypothetical protein AAFP90_20690 [Planctomycetota bacterium]
MCWPNTKPRAIHLSCLIGLSLLAIGTRVAADDGTGTPAGRSAATALTASSPTGTLPPGAPSPNTAEPAHPDDTGRSVGERTPLRPAGCPAMRGPGLLHFQLRFGRLCLDVSRHRKGKHCRRSPDQKTHEQLCVDDNESRVTVHYILNTPYRQFIVDSMGSDYVRIEMIFANDRAVLTQNPTTGLHLKCFSEGATLPTTYRDDDLFGLYDQNRVAFDRYLTAILDRLLVGASFHDMHAQVQRHNERVIGWLKQESNVSSATQETIATKASPPNAGVVSAESTDDPLSNQQLIDALASNQASVRNRAEHQLRSRGLLCLSEIKRCLREESDLTSEQQARLRRIESELLPYFADLPMIIATIQATR